MLEFITSKIGDAKLVSKLFNAAEQHALADQQPLAGAEHFLLAAFDLPDDTAQAAFDKIEVDPSELRAAIARQYQDAVSAVGIDAAEILANDTTPLPKKRLAYKTSASGQEVAQLLAEDRHNHAPLLGAHVVAAVAGMKRGVAARALHAMGVDAIKLRAAAQEIIG